MLTRCPACETNFRVTAEQLKARSGRVRCGECQHVFNALDSLIEEPMVVAAQPAPALPRESVASAPSDVEATSVTEPEGIANDIAVSPAPTFVEPSPEPIPEMEGGPSTLSPPELAGPPTSEPTEVGEPETVEPANEETGAIEPIAAEAEAPDWSETFPEPPPPPRRWPWIIGSLAASIAIGVQAALAFRVELAVLWPEARPALITLCDFADCEVGLPTRVALVSIEASDLYPDKEHPGRLALTATLKNRAPFAQQFPHLELTLTDTADKAIARKILAPTDYLPPKTALANGMLPNADILVAIGVDPGEMTASGYRLYLFYP
ncbi:MAG: DUF3426 domain-containing protein [Sulfuritalea sp.]|nr:DUF3426 domain-containing protein [Sulfuritalea sp.]